MKVDHDSMTDHSTRANLIHFKATYEHDMGQWRTILTTYILRALKGNTNTNIITFAFLFWLESSAAAAFLWP